MTFSQHLSALILLSLPLTIMAQQSVPDTAEAKLVSSPQEFELDGVIEAINQATLSSEVSGRVEEILFDVDDIVKKGEVIVRIRDREYRARLQKTKAALSEAKTGFDDASREFKRIKGLFKDKVISRAVYDKTSANLDSAHARVTASEASVSEAQLQLDNTVIRAPYSGVVVARHVELGESTNIGKPVMSGYAVGKLRVKVNVPQSIINKVREHRKARVIIIDESDSISASKLTIFPFADAQSHSFRVRLDLPQSGQPLFPGMLVKVAFVIDKNNRLMIPSGSIVQRSEVTGAYIVDADQQLSFRQLRTGVNKDGLVEIVAGLDAGEKVALDPIQAGIRLKAQWAKQ